MAGIGNKKQQYRIGYIYPTLQECSQGQGHNSGEGRDSRSRDLYPWCYMPVCPMQCIKQIIIEFEVKMQLWWFKKQSWIFTKGRYTWDYTQVKEKHI